MRVFLSYQSLSIIFTCFFATLGLSQPSNDNCNDAVPLCPNVSLAGSNIGASAENCGNCADDFNFCFVPSGTVWYSFTTNNIGGNVTIAFSSVVLQNNPNAGEFLQAAVVSATNPCDGGTYTLHSNCESSANNDFVLNANGLNPNSEYFVIVGGDNSTSVLPAGGSFNIMASGPGIDPINPSLVITTDSTTVCDNVLVNFTATTDCGTNARFEWFVNGNLVSSSNLPQFQTTDLLDQDEVSAIVYCGEDCFTQQVSNTIQINVISVDVTAGPDQIITSGQTVQLTGATSGQIVGWSPSSSLSDPLSINPFATPEVTTTYTLAVTDGNCISFDEVTVVVVSEVYPTNTITPNGDDINDFWEIAEIERFPDCEIVIYDRWGQLVFESRGYSHDNRWDGTKNGKKLNEGVYFYVINLNNPAETVVRGAISLIR